MTIAPWQAIFIVAISYAWYVLGVGMEPGASFYIYDWPDYIYDVWPPMNASLNENSTYSHKFRGNNGAGVAVDPDLGYFSTWQFSMFQLTMARLRASPLRTLNPAEAMSFIVPFDIGVHSYIDHMNGRTRVASPHGWRVIEWLKESIDKLGGEVVWKNRGHDHFVLFSITSYQIIGIGAKIFLTQVCQNCSVLTIETTPTLTSRKYYANKSRKWWYAVPYPSSFHWHEGIRTLPWKQQGVMPRRHLAIFIGSVDTSTPRSNVLRRRMRRDCSADSSGQCLWFDTAHSCSGVLNVTDGMMLYRHTTFCLAPTGDSLTRKSLFDSLAAGCIPVVFAKATISQYFWHMPAAIVDEIAVHIPAQQVIDGSVNFLDVLRNITSEEVARYQKRIEEVAPSLQYAIVPAGYGADAAEALRYYRLDKYGYQQGREQALLPVQENDFFYRGTTWSPPMPDAVDVIVARLLTRSTVEPMEGFTPEQVSSFARMRDDISAEDPDYTGLVRISQVLASKEKRKRDREALRGLGLDGYVDITPASKKGSGGGGGGKRRPGRKKGAAGVPVD